MTTWLVFITAVSLRGRTPTLDAARELQTDLTRLAGITGEAGIDPEAAVADGKLDVRQSFRYVTPTQAATMAADNLRRTLRPDDIDSIRVVKLDDWLSEGEL